MEKFSSLFPSYLDVNKKKQTEQKSNKNIKLGTENLLFTEYLMAVLLKCEGESR